MDTNLFKVSEVCWAVTSKKDGGEVHTFRSIEDASTYLESIGVLDEEVDYALVDMMANNSVRANFGFTNGSFIFSDNKKLDDIIGSA